MNRTWLSRSLLITIFVSASSWAFAQDEPEADAVAIQQAEAARAAEAERQQEEARFEAERALTEARLQEFIHADRPLPPEPDKEAQVKARFEEFRKAIPAFRAATQDYRRALVQNGDRNKPAKEMEAQVRVMLRYFSATKTKHPRIDPSEFKSYSPSQLEWETLNSAERIVPDLQLAVRAERADTVSTKLLEFRYKLNGDLLRLQWLAEHRPRKS